MAEDQDNIVIRMLREIRSDTQDTRQRLTRLGRHIGEIREQMVTANGIAGLASVSTEKHGESMDEIRDEIAAPKRRVQELEARK